MILFRYDRLRMLPDLEASCDHDEQVHTNSRSAVLNSRCLRTCVQLFNVVIGPIHTITIASRVMHA